MMTRRRIKNPAIPRLEWIANNYPDWVWVYTVMGLFQALALDTESDDFADQAREAMVDQGDLVARGEDTLSVPESLEHRVAEILEFSGNENTKYDRYLPWLANRLNAIGKKPSKRVRNILKGLFPDMIFPAVEWLGNKPAKIYADPFRFTIYGGVLRWAVDDIVRRGGSESDMHDARAILNASVGSCDRLAEGFGGIVLWAEEEGKNLNDYDGIEALELAKKWLQMRKRSGNIVQGETVYTFDDGWTFQELKTRKQLECEGDAMGHCVGGFSPSQIGKKYRIFSLRDPDGVPYVTMEWNVPYEYVKQYKSEANEWPDKEAVQRAIEFRRKYLDEKLVSPESKLEQVSHYSEAFPPYVGEFRGVKLVGVYMPPGRPDLAFANYEGGFREQMVSAWGLGQFVEDQTDFAAKKFGAGDQEAVDEYVLEQVRKTAPSEIPYSQIELTEYPKSISWEVWKLTGGIFGDDELLEQAGYYDIPHKEPKSNPRKRKTPEYKRLIDKCHRLWETYDAKPLKKNLVAFGKHIERMKASESVKVKTEARRAARAFNKEFKAQGWRK